MDKFNTNMENRQNINRVELRGVVGTARINETREGRIVRFSLATNYVYRASDGMPVIETIWHSCIAFECGHVSGLDRIVKGTVVHLTGRIRCRRFVDINNAERNETEIVADSLEVL